MVINGNTFEKDDAIAYKAYGKQIPLMEPSEKTRERFTGKELDEDGKTALITLDIEISDFTDIPVTVTRDDAQLTIIYQADGGVEPETDILNLEIVHLSNQVWLKEDIPVSEYKTIDKIFLTVNGTAPEISYLVDTEDKNIELGDSMAIVLHQPATGDNALPYSTSVITIDNM